MIICPLLSGSSGNATYVASGSTRILIDAGASGASLEANLREIGVDPSDLTHILVTHAHDDHIRGVGVMSRRYGLPLYASEGVWTEMTRGARIGRVPTRFMKVFCSTRRQTLHLGDVDVDYFSTPHDAYDSVGYVVSDGDVKFGIATDFGFVTPSIRQSLSPCDAVLLEANYDYDMLWNGPYPYLLKQRVAGPRGHLDNRDAGQFAAELARQRARYIYLGHLSEHNNTQRLAYDAVKKCFDESELELEKDCFVYMTRRYKPSRLLVL